MHDRIWEFRHLTFPRRLRPWRRSRKVDLYSCRVSAFSIYLCVLFHTTTLPPSTSPRRLRPWRRSPKVNLYLCRVSMFSIWCFIWLVRLPDVCLHEPIVFFDVCLHEPMMLHMTCAPPSTSPRRLRPWTLIRKVDLHLCRVLAYYVWWNMRI